MTEDQIRARLAMFYDAFEIALWIMLPHPQLAGKSPRHTIDAGHIVDVEAIVSHLEIAELQANAVPLGA